MKVRDQKQIDALTSLRFFAALAVILYHSGASLIRETGDAPVFLQNLLSNGFLGVPFFFILSGFILTYVYYGRLTPESGLWTYGVNRFARVYPVYLLALLTLFPFMTGWAGWREIPQFFLLQIWLPHDMVHGRVFRNWNGPAWTLSVELLFYVTFPFLLAWFEGWTTRSIVIGGMLVVGTILAFRLPAAFPGGKLPYEPMYAIPTPILRLPEFVYGILLGILFRRDHIPSSRPRLILSIAAMIGLMCITNSLWIAPVLAIIFGCIIALTATSLDKGALAYVLKNRWFVLLGAASYAMYILQNPINIVNRAAFGPEHELIGRLIYIPSVIGISVLIHLLYEEPLRRLIRRLTNRREHVTIRAGVRREESAS